MEEKETCPKCEGRGEVYSGYWTHPETYGSREPLMYRCLLCNGDGKVSKEVALEERCKRMIDPF